MSSVGYSGLLYRVSQKLKNLSKINQIFFSCRRAGLIAEESESYNIQVNPGDNIAVIVMKLFSDLEEQDNLGIDNLENLRDLLKEVKEWSLIDEVDKFERQRNDFNTLLETIIPKLDVLDNLEQLISLCTDQISEDVKGDIKDVRSLFKELEKKKRLGFSRLAILKKILNETGEQELLDALMKFEKKWKAEEVAERRKDRAADVVNAVIVTPAAALHSTVKHTWEQMIGAVKMHCKFSTVSGLLLAVGTGIILRQGAQAQSLREFVDAFTEAVLPAATGLRTLSESSVCFTVQAENRQALKALWERYQDGTLQKSLQEFLVTDDIKQLANGEEVVVDVEISEQEYKNACLSFVIAEEQGELQKENQEMPLKRTRRNSDSILYARSKENKAMLVLLKLREEEIKFHQEKIESLEKEIEKLTAQIQVASGRAHESTPSKLTTGEFEGEYLSRRQEKETQEGQGLKRFRPAATSKLQIGECKGPVVSTAQGTEALEIPRKKRRRNSDSDLYCKARDEDTKKREREQETFLGEEKYVFVQRYLEEAHETHSVVTLTSDSGHVTHGTESEFGMEDIPDDTLKLYLKDLSENVISELEERLEGDKDAMRLVYQSFGITRPPPLSRMSTSGYRSFGIPEPKIVDIFRLFPDTPVKLLKDVFGALQLFDLLELLEQQTKPLTTRSLRMALTLDEIKKLRNTADRRTTYHSCAAVLIIADDEDDSDAIEIKTFFTDLDTKSDVTVIQCRDFYRRQREEILMQWGGFIDPIMMRKRKYIETAALTVIERWIQRKDNFPFFAVFDLSSLNYTPLLSWFGKLVSGIPDKPKLLVLRGLSISLGRPETLQVTLPEFVSYRLLLEILNKRWQTLDLISMMTEFKRSVYVKKRRLHISIQDSLSSLPRFKRKEDLSLSH